ncbi:2-amino-4-hydroxy-6-hydroxymethyldihydropteridine diphosphokinase [Parathalassolituus penaei]|uniref:2-amino-4-hydroxy-6-hydroxymethyldihydropteridine diphosphokinase n=1 Tax=Parathalassolituus penaei TaxID=2997323 RepID=A0A9X3IRI3_9GAMM|nr:2-amino-4-hydroxy-6-hydroxymethyldihydropteridine diphosphokinase [Parathalassolituus penaei]MCY0963879.1 2-amino-4-hydroxy-6-hydroxymethyldihydropteridine diphosphokinase [Parathalassolituus penaei]
MARIYLGIGSNLNPDVQIPGGLAALAELVTIVNESPWYRSPAVGFDGPDFINLVVEAETPMTVRELAAALKELEVRFGRTPDAVKFSSRSLDVDILLYDGLSGVVDGVRLPRRDIRQFAFVLRPLLDIAPDVICPQNGHCYAEDWPALADQPLTRIEH